MKQYYYKDGTPVRVGDIFFYSEYHPEIDDDITNRYADGIGMICGGHNDLLACFTVCTMNEAKSFIKVIPSLLSTDIELQHYQGSNKNGYLPDMQKIGEYPTDKEMLLKEYANMYYSRYDILTDGQ